MTDPTTRSEELKPCPFCGSEAKAWTPSYDGKAKYVFCVNSVTCGAEVSLYEEGQDAITAWNHRTPKSDDRLREALEEARTYFRMKRGMLGTVIARGKLLAKIDAALRARSTQETNNGK